MVDSDRGAALAPTREVSVEALPVPSPIRPVADAVIRQNDPSTACPVDNQGGYGHQILFDWSDVSLPTGIGDYELWAKNDQAPNPIVHVSVVASEHTERSCGSYVIDAFLTGWTWQVRARDVRGNVSRWSTPATFRFQPCFEAAVPACR